MRVAAHDQGYVPAPPDQVYARLVDLATYEDWWPGTRIRTRSDHLKRLQIAFRRRFVGVEAVEERAGTGLVLQLSSPFRGTLEWYLEPFRNGTIVNGILDLDLAGGSRGSRRGLLRLRACIRRGVVGLANALE